MASKRGLGDDLPEEESLKPRRRTKLSGEQLQRKRASDREAQRVLREKTKGQIAHLENLVQALQGGQNGRVERLITQVEQQRTEISRLRSALLSISKLAEVAKDALESSTADDTPPTAEEHEVLDTSPENALQTHDLLDPAHWDATLGELFSHSGHTSLLPLLDPGSTNDSNSSARDHSACALPDRTDKKDEHRAVSTDRATRAPSISQMATAIVRKENLDGRFWFLAGTILNYLLKNQQNYPIHTDHDEDIAIRAVYESWSAVIERYPLDKGWQWLKELDEHIYSHGTPEGRLIILRNCRLQLLHQLDPTAGWDRSLPAFFQPRPSQQHIEHDPLIEYFPWPGFREQVLFSPTKFATNTFMSNVRHQTVFVWPYDAHDTYVKNAVTGEYSYSDALMRQAMNIGSYTATKTFFETFPDLRSEIPQNELTPSIARSICMTADSDSPGSDRHDRSSLRETENLAD